jgi:hypothetical protein
MKHDLWTAPANRALKKPSSSIQGALLPLQRRLRALSVPAPHASRRRSSAITDHDAMRQVWQAPWLYAEVP